MKKNILVIEDDKFLRGLIVEKLTAEGFGVSQALDGEEGLKKTKEEKPDLVLLDLILPGINGFEVLEKIKEDEEAQRIPVIILSNLGQKEDVDKAMGLGAADYIVKAHFTPEEIVQRIQRIVP